MPQFAFVAKDRMGNTVQGKLDAPDAALAANQIGRMGYALVELGPADGPSQTPADPVPDATRSLPAGADYVQPTVAPPAPASRPASAPLDLHRTTEMAPAQAMAASAPGTAVPDNSATDLLRADVERRRKVEMDLARMGMKPDEIRRLIDANANTTAAPPDAVGLGAAGAAASSTAATPRNKRQATQQKLVARSADLHSFAAQLQASNASARVQAVEAVTLDLPPFREASRQEREQADVLLREVFALRRREKYVDALAKCRQAIELIPSDAAALETFGDLLQGLARTDEAMAAYKRATEADSKRYSAERKYGDLLMRQQRWSEADPEEVPKSPVAAAVFSLLIPGAGQIHVGQTVKGIVLMLCAALAMGAIYFVTRDQTPFETTEMKRGRVPAAVHRERTHVDRPGDLPVIACMGFYVLLSLGSAIDAANGARQTRR